MYSLLIKLLITAVIEHKRETKSASSKYLSTGTATNKTANGIDFCSSYKLNVKNSPLRIYSTYLLY